MASLKKITNFLDDYLKINEIKDSSVNGLQVSGKENINKIAFAVDACIESFAAAKEAGADMIIVHHGLIWKGITSVTGITYDRLKFLIENEISLYAAHLPLDKHPEIGNNIEFLKLFNVKNPEEFGDYHGIFIGFMGEFEEEKNINDFASEIEKKLIKGNFEERVMDIIKYFAKNFQYQHIDLYFEGGEPLLNFPLIKSVVEQIKEESKITNTGFNFFLYTNGILLGNTKILDFLDKNNIEHKTFTWA